MKYKFRKQADKLVLVAAEYWYYWRLQASGSIDSTWNSKKVEEWNAGEISFWKMKEKILNKKEAIL